MAIPAGHWAPGPRHHEGMHWEVQTPPAFATLDALRPVGMASLSALL